DEHAVYVGGDHRREERRRRDLYAIGLVAGDAIAAGSVIPHLEDRRRRRRRELQRHARRLAGNLRDEQRLRGPSGRDGRWAEAEKGDGLRGRRRRREKCRQEDAATAPRHLVPSSQKTRRRNKTITRVAAAAHHRTG